MDRVELEQQDRATLITQAEEAGVARANILTRPELIDELLVRTAKKGDKDLPRARGFFGRARDLVARVIEKGLHLPDAAERLRQVSASQVRAAGGVTPAVVPTVTLAEIYAAQGHRTRAIDTLRRVLELEPDHGAAEALLTNLESAPATIPPAVPAPEGEGEEADHDVAPSTEDTPSPPASVSASETHCAAVEAPARSAPRDPIGFLDDDPLPIRYDVDECVAIAVDPVTLYVYWEVREASLEHVRHTRQEGSLCLRLLVITPSWDGPRSAVRDFDVDSAVANRTVRDLPAGAVIRAAIGWREGETFVPIAHAPALETPAGRPCPVVADAFIRWTPRGLAPVSSQDADYPSITRALGHMPPRADAGYGLSNAPLGSSELSAGFRQDAPPAAPVSEAHAPSSEAMI